MILQQIHEKVAGIWLFDDWLIHGLHILITTSLRNLSADYKTDANDVKKY